MTVIIAIKDKNSIWLGADRMISNDVTKSHSNVPKFFKKEFQTYTPKETTDSKGHKDIKKTNIEKHYLIFAGAGSDSVNSYIQYAFKFPDKIREDPFETYLLLDVLPSIKEELSLTGLLKTDNAGANDTEANFLIIYDNEVYPIYRDLGYGPSNEEYTVIGIGDEIAYGSLYTTKYCPPEQRINIAIKACAYHTLFIDDNIDLIEIKPEDYNFS